MERTNNIEIEHETLLDGDQPQLQNPLSTPSSICNDIRDSPLQDSNYTQVREIAVKTGNVFKDMLKEFLYDDILNYVIEVVDDHGEVVEDDHGEVEKGQRS